MSISIAICELDAAEALCRSLKTRLIKVLLDDITGFEGLVEYDDVVTLEDAQDLIPDWESFIKRNRLSEETNAVYIDKIKNDADLELLRTRSKKVSTGWLPVEGLEEDALKKALSASKEENRITGWDMVSFEETAEMCAVCPLSWDKGRGCIGAFGPENSALPEIAERRGCRIVASVPEGSRTNRIYTPEDASALINEIAVLESALPEEGKVYVRRYTGCLERLRAVADISVREKCGFYFF